MGWAGVCCANMLFRSHLLDRHNPEVLCDNCGQSHPDLSKHGKGKCQQRSYCLMTKEQADAIRKFRVRESASDVPWYEVLKILIPKMKHVSTDKLRAMFPAGIVPTIKATH